MDRRDDGLLAISWLVTLTVVLVVVGVLAFDGISLLVGRVGAENDAQTAATAAALSFQDTHNIETAYAAAQAAVTNPHEQVMTTGFSVAADGSAHVVLARQVKTVVIGHLSWLEHDDTQTVSAVESPPTL